MRTVSAEVPHQDELPNANQRGRSRRRKYVRWTASAVVLLAVAALLPLLHNNFRFSKLPRATFDEELDLRLERAFDRFDSRTMSLSYYDPNSALLYMICDMAEMTGDERLQGVLRQYLARYPNSFWNQLVFSRHPVESSTEIVPVSPQKVATYKQDTRWFYYAVGGDPALVPEPELQRLLSPTANRARDLTHQLFALNLLRERVPDYPDLVPLIDTLCGRITDEATIDFRVTDMYIQRVSFLLGSGRDDLVRPRWIEKIMAQQLEDGGWCWHWRINPFAREESSNDHTSVQAAWALCLIKYRFPDWVERHYPE